MIHFQKTTIRDVRALTKVQIKTFDHDSKKFLGIDTGGPPGYDSEEWQIQIMQKADYYKIVKDNKIIGGFIIFNPRKGEYVLGRIYIDPDYQDRGIGTQAMKFMLNKYSDAVKWSLDTPSWAIRNHYFYEKLGFVKVKESKADLEGYSDIFYEKETK